MKDFMRRVLSNNPTFCLFLGLCSTLAVSTSIENGLGMGIATLLVLVFSNTIISMLRRVIPSKGRLPCYVMIIATFVTIIGSFLEAFSPALHSRLGIYLPLIVVNCIVLGRVEAFASKNKPLPSLIDALAIGLSFTSSLLIISFIRELFGTGKIILFGAHIINLGIAPVRFLIEPSGALFLVGMMIPLYNLTRRWL